MDYNKFLKESEIVNKTKYSVVIKKSNSIIDGHLIILPIKQVNYVQELTDDEFMDICLLIKGYAPVSDDIGITVAFRNKPFLFCHVIPRKEGDLKENYDIYTDTYMNLI